jgi:hypothetical protein
MKDDTRELELASSLDASLLTSLLIGWLGIGHILGPEEYDSKY